MARFVDARDRGRCNGHHVMRHDGSLRVEELGPGRYLFTLADGTPLGELKITLPPKRKKKFMACSGELVMVTAETADAPASTTEPAESFRTESGASASRAVRPA